ncbi:hypothetical protein HAX54_029492 [Datura stramonium]|uniref:Peptidase S1 domain-containing protein n=1 Tax=Datura stramonium TaxID=4076 RepID=A0ABS8V8Y1_DATST|nr:hypothetical protein [Datura stramonium]
MASHLYLCSGTGAENDQSSHTNNMHLYPYGTAYNASCYTEHRVVVKASSVLNAFDAENLKGLIPNTISVSKIEMGHYKKDEITICKAEVWGHCESPRIPNTLSQILCHLSVCMNPGHINTLLLGTPAQSLIK